MKVFGLHRSFYQASKINGATLSEKARFRLEKVHLFWVLQSKGITSFEAAIHLKVSRANLFRWSKLLKTSGPRALEPRPKRPKHVRHAQWSLGLVNKVRSLRKEYPAWGKAKLRILMKREGYTASESTVGRILKYLLRQGLIQSAPQLRKATKHQRTMKRWYAQRLPKGLKSQEPGELIQVDTVHINLFAGFSFKQFTAYCPVAHWTVADAYTQATSRNASDFLRKMLQEMPFTVRGIQVDGGSEFMKDFEEACANLKLKLYVLPPRSPKLNGSVERANGAWRYEFYWAYDLPSELSGIRARLKAFQKTYNTIRPHQSLNGMTPEEYLNMRCPRAA